MKVNGVIGALRAVAIGAALLVSNAATAGIIITKDTADALEGQFSISGLNPGFVATAIPTVFALLPGVDTPASTAPANIRQLELYRPVNEPSVAFRTSQEGLSGDPNVPGDPTFQALIPDVDTTFPDLSGFYTNAGQVDAGGTRVNWLFSAFRDTGNRDGTFTGNFCFSTSPLTACSPTSVPEPATLALLGLGLAGLAASRRRMR